MSTERSTTQNSNAAPAPAAGTAAGARGCWTLPAWITSNIDKYYFVRYQTMMLALRSAREDDAFKVADELLLVSQMPRESRLTPSHLQM